ncbi:hypothetical protein [Rathayibacter agropyri]
MEIPLIDLPNYQDIYLVDLLGADGKYHSGIMLSARHTKVMKYHLAVTMADGTRFLVGHGRNPLNMHMEPLTVKVLGTKADGAGDTGLLPAEPND